MIRVAIVDDQELARTGFRLVLERAEGIEVSVEAEDGLQAVSRIAHVGADVALMDIRMPRMDGLEATRRLAERVPDVKVLVLTTFDDEATVHAALRAGASGFLLKDVAAAELVRAIRVVHAGEPLLAPAVLRRLVDDALARGAPPVPPPELDELTAREREVFGLLAQGATNDEISAALVVSAGTAKAHVSRTLAKLGLRDRAQAVVLAYEHGLVRPGERGVDRPGNPG